MKKVNMIKNIKKNIIFTLVELLIVIAVIAILAGLLLPALKSAKEKAKEINCGNQQKQIFSAMSMYELDYNGYIPQARNPDNSSLHWMWYMAPYVPNKVFLCPADKSNYLSRWKIGTPTPPDGWPLNYPSPITVNLGFNYGANKAQYNSFTWAYSIRFNVIKCPSEYMFILDIRKGSYLTATDFVSTADYAVSYPHVNSVNITFGDGHLKPYKYPTPFGVYVSTFPNGSRDSKLWTGE